MLRDKTDLIRRSRLALGDPSASRTLGSRLPATNRHGQRRFSGKSGLGADET
jgi:hypothetical protein